MPVYVQRCWGPERWVETRAFDVIVEGPHLDAIPQFVSGLVSVTGRVYGGGVTGWSLSVDGFTVAAQAPAEAFSQYSWDTALSLIHISEPTR
ncbi:MAG: hypothetical protein QUS33_09940, partial [Dehalococcoidia bacterium]|nr:hypothetical protein [Dehalococcoidia bacterium]